MKNLPARVGIRALAAACIAMLAACATQSPPDAVVNEGSSSFQASLRQRGETASWVTYAQNLADYLPSQLISHEGEEPRAGALGVVYGQVSRAEVTFAGRVEEDEASSDGISVALDSPDADWRMVTTTVVIERSWLSDPSVKETVEFVIPVAGTDDPSVTIKALEAMDRVVVVLTHRDATAPHAYRVALETAIGEADADGRITFPAMTRAAQTEFLGGILTLEDVDRQAKEPQPVISVDSGTPSGRG